MAMPWRGVAEPSLVKRYPAIMTSSGAFGRGKGWLKWNW
jgi:hypothetical protein